MTRQSYTAVVERNCVWEGRFETEPYEAAWAAEAIFFVRALESAGELGDVRASVQISPDGMHWCDEGTLIELPATAEAMAFGRVHHFGGWLRLAGRVPAEAQIKVIVYLALKE